MNPAIIVDIDATLANRHRRHPLDVDLMMHDTPIVPTVTLIKVLQRAEFPILFVTDRPETARQVTMDWLHEQGLPNDELFMRADDDARSDSVVKRSVFEDQIRGKWQILFAIDNNEKVIHMWRSVGVFTLQV